MNIKTIVLVAAATTFSAPAFSATMIKSGLSTCESATLSNKKAKKWEISNTTQPKTDSKYFAYINASPWCSVIPAKDGHANHKSIMHYNKNGIGTELNVHKVGETSWIRSNWRTIKRACVVPNNFGLTTLPYRKTPAKKCNVKVITNINGVKRLHQWGKRKAKKARVRVRGKLGLIKSIVDAVL